jgi:3-oxoacyl-[acyl-carrier-protein] synthase III
MLRPAVSSCLKNVLVCDSYAGAGQMKILAIRHAVPSCVVTNDDIVQMVKTASNGSIDGKARLRIEGKIRNFLDRAGTKLRYRLSADETANALLRSAVNDALAAAKLDAAQLDFIIYAGVSRGWLEPSMAALVQREIEAQRAACFDILEACASWIRAMQVAQAFFQAGTYRRGMIVNCECAVSGLGPFALASEDDLEKSLAGYTIGEAATATIVEAQSESDAYVVMRSFGEHCDLCMIPLANADSFLPSLDSGRHTPNRFYSDSETLFKKTLGYLWDTYLNDAVLSERRHDIFFSHAASAKAGVMARRKLAISEDRWYCTHARFGNTVAASVPLGMSSAIDDGVLSRGDRLLAIVGSAGISVGFLSLTF